MKNKTSSYLDLSPLYGRNAKQQRKIRKFEDGLLKKDAFADKRLLLQPPGVCALMIAFNRFHNSVVKTLAKINENDRFSVHNHDDPKEREKRDNDLFQTGRL